MKKVIIPIQLLTNVFYALFFIFMKQPWFIVEGIRVTKGIIILTSNAIIFFFLFLSILISNILLIIQKYGKIALITWASAIGITLMLSVIQFIKWGGITSYLTQWFYVGNAFLGLSICFFIVFYIVYTKKEQSK